MVSNRVHLLIRRAQSYRMVTSFFLIGYKENYNKQLLSIYNAVDIVLSHYKALLTKTVYVSYYANCQRGLGEDKLPFPALMDIHMIWRAFIYFIF